MKATSLVLAALLSATAFSPSPARAVALEWYVVSQVQYTGAPVDLFAFFWTDTQTSTITSWDVFTSPSPSPYDTHFNTTNSVYNVGSNSLSFFRPSDGSFVDLYFNTSALFTANIGGGNLSPQSFLLVDGSIAPLTGNLTGGTDFVTPLPASLPLFATALGALGLIGWRRKRKAAAL